MISDRMRPINHLIVSALYKSKTKSLKEVGEIGKIYITSINRNITCYEFASRFVQASTIDNFGLL